MIRIVRKLLVQIIKDIDSGNSNLTDDEMLDIVKLLKSYTEREKLISKYQAYTYLNISRSKFDSLVRDGLLPKGKKIAGFKELFWDRNELKRPQ